MLSLALGVAALVRMASLYQVGADPSRVYYGTDTHAGVILFGAVLGALSAGTPIVRRGFRTIVVVTGMLSLLALGAAFVTASVTSSWLYEGGYGVIVLAIVLVLLAAAQPGRNPLRKVFETRGLVGLGLISYGVYLWHWPMFIWLTPSSVGASGALLFIVRVAATLAVSIPSYYFVEQPIRQGRFLRGHLSKGGLRFPGLVPLSAVTVVAMLLIFPSVILPSVATAPATGVKTRATCAASLSYETAPRCDAKPNPPIKLGSARQPFRVQLVGELLRG